MKQMNVLVSVILVAAVLIAAYAVGLLVKQGRTTEPQTQSQDVSEPNQVESAQTPTAQDVPKLRPGRRELSAEERATIKEEQAAKIADANEMTEAEKIARQDEIRQQLLRPSSTLQAIEMTAEEKARVRENRSNLPANEIEKLRRAAQLIKAMQEKPPEDANTPSSQGSLSGEDGKAATSDPNAAATQ